MTPAIALKRVQARQDLSAENMEAVMQTVMAGHVDAETLQALLVALRDKGEAVSEIVGAARAMRACSVKLTLEASRVLDTCGTGGAGLGVFNVSTAAALTAAACGAVVAKHGNRAVSSQSGSADVLRAAGVRIELEPDQVKHCIEQIGIGFLFAPSHHPAMKHAAPVRQAIGTRTLFNLLGPLTNPAGATHQLIGLFDARWLVPYAETLQQLGSTRAMVVTAQDGLDELSLNTPTDFAALDQDTLTTGTLSAEQFGLTPAPLSEVQADSPQASLQMILNAFDGQPGAPADLICFNAGVALYVAEIADDIAEGIALARSALENGQAQSRLEQLIEVSHR